jgi:PERQ amino acid-rich with GYF domain-containing protein
MGFCRARRTNGATQTFRRPSVATSMTSSNPPGAQPAVYVPPHRNGPAHSDTRYSKDQMLDLFHKLTVEASLEEALPDLYVAGWEPIQTNGVSLGGWGRRDEQAKDHAPGPEVCWDKDGTTIPLGLVDMDDEEREVSCRSRSYTHAEVLLTNLHSTLCPSTLR